MWTVKRELEFARSTLTTIVEALHEARLNITNIQLQLRIYASDDQRPLEVSTPLAEVFEVADAESHAIEQFDCLTEATASMNVGNSSIAKTKVPTRIVLSTFYMPSLDALSIFVAVGRTPLSRSHFVPRSLVDSLAQNLLMLRALQRTWRDLDRRIAAMLPAKLGDGDAGPLRAVTREDEDRPVRVTLPSPSTRRMPRIFALDPIDSPVAQKPIILDARSLAGRPPPSLRPVLRDDAERRRAFAPRTSSPSMDAAASGLLDVGNVIAHFFEVVGGLGDRYANAE